MRDMIETLAIERLEERLDDMEAHRGNATDNRPHFRAH
jgi:hypothetical protein